MTEITDDNDLHKLCTDKEAWNLWLNISELPTDTIIKWLVENASDDTIEDSAYINTLKMRQGMPYEIPNQGTVHDKVKYGYPIEELILLNDQVISNLKDNSIAGLQKSIVQLEKERYDKAVKLENTREKLLLILKNEGMLEYPDQYYDLRSEYYQLHIPVEVMGRKYNTNVMLINMGMSWESFENALFNEKPDKKNISKRIAILKADFERVKEMFKAEYVMEIKTHD